MIFILTITKKENQLILLFYVQFYYDLLQVEFT